MTITEAGLRRKECWAMGSKSRFRRSVAFCSERAACSKLSARQTWSLAGGWFELITNVTFTAAPDIARKAPAPARTKTRRDWQESTHSLKLSYEPRVDQFC